jgi:uncharacterized glyoxalase superfamily protein PhnB
MDKQIIVPMLSYADGIKALNWLTRAFGFTEKVRLIAPDGSLSHGEIELNGARIIANIVKLPKNKLHYPG